MEDFKVGDRIPVYEIITDSTGYPAGMFVNGQWRMGEIEGKESSFLYTGEYSLRGVRGNRTIISPDFHPLFVKRSSDGELNIKKVGTMVVKKLKNI